MGLVLLLAGASAYAQMDDLRISVSTDKSEYLFGESVQISGNITGGLPAAWTESGVALVFLTVDGPAYHVEFLLHPDQTMRYGTTLNLQSALGISAGTYLINASYAGVATQTEFTVGEDKVEEVEVEAAELSISADKIEYHPGEMVEITGVVTKTVPLAGVMLNVMGPDGETFHGGTLYPGEDGRFYTEVYITTVKPSFGTYMVSVEYDELLAETAFIVTSQSQIIEPESMLEPLTVWTDKTIYERGSKILIGGRINEIRYGGGFYTSPVEIRIVNAGGVSDIRLTAIPDTEGNYSIEETLHDITYVDGEYTVVATYADGIKAHTRFTVETQDYTAGVFSLVINKDVVGLGEEVVVDGVIPGLPEGSGITVTLYKPDGDKDEFGVTLDRSRFTWVWNAPQYEKDQIVTNTRGVIPSNYGIYRVDFSTSSASGSVMFKVSPDPENDSLEVPPIHVTTDKEFYATGQKMTVSGEAQKRIQDIGGMTIEDRVHVIVKHGSPPYKKIYEAFLFLDHGGRFQTVFSLPVGVFSDGRYVVTAKYGERIAESVFMIDNERDARAEMVIQADRSEYNPGDQIRITGRLIGGGNIDNANLLIIHESQTQMECGLLVCGRPVYNVTAPLDRSGMFNHVYVIPKDAVTSLGRYEIRSSAGSGDAGIEFVVIPAPTAGNTRFTEKSNRIPDTEIPITLRNVMYDGVELSPRTLQGSLLTNSRAHDASVNIRVEGAGGVCVIGAAEECLVSGLTRSSEGIYRTVEIDGVEYRVRYTGPDVVLEKFVVLPALEGPIHVEEWRIIVLKDDQPSRVYYKITYVDLG